MTRFSVNKFKTNRIRILIILLLPLALQACTVKEDREPCPCYLDVDYSAMLESKLLGRNPGNVDVAVFVPEETCQTTFRLADCPDLNENIVERSMAQVVGVVHNRLTRDFLSAGGPIVYAAGNQIDSVFVHTSTVDCRGEDAYCRLDMHKQFHTLYLNDEFDGDALREYNLVVKGSTCGFDARSLEAIEGEYLYTVQEYDSEGRISVRVPRQIKDDLILEMWTKDDYRRVFVAPIGQYMKATGYDKDAVDLVDFDIMINFRLATLYVRVADWDDEFVSARFE